VVEEKKHSPIPGLILIVIGILILLSNFEIFDLEFGTMWIYIIILLGALFWIGFLFDRSQAGRLMPGTVLLTIGLVFYYSERGDWDPMAHLWPFFILAPAFGFYAMVFIGKRERGLLIPAGILTVIGLFFLLESFDYEFQLILGIALVVIGVLLLVKFIKGKEANDKSER
jgi:hypothetical protein